MVSISPVQKSPRVTVIKRMRDANDDDSLRTTVCRVLKSYQPSQSKTMPQVIKIKFYVRFEYV